MPKLNEQQKQAADFVDGVCAVIAVPGSGKTLTMTERIGNLVKKHGIPPEHILGLTFTRNAAESMRTRLVPVLDDMAHRVTLSTIHSFCYLLLKTEGKVFEILSGKDQLIFLRKIMKKLNIKDLSVGMVIREISLAKNNLISLEELRVMHEGDRTMLLLADIAEEYEREKERQFLYDFEDLLRESYRLLTINPDVLEKYRGMFRHLLVDEFQDTNPAQMEVIRLLLTEEPGTSFWVCGDDWQSIYAFNGASIGNILNFTAMFPGSREFILSENYRSTPEIIEACQNLISHNERKIEKVLSTKNPKGDPIMVLESQSEEDEAERIVTEIMDLRERGYACTDMAILYRANFQSRVIEESFSQHRIPYSIENGLNFYDRREVRILLDYLRLISRPETEDGDDALRSVINIPNRYIGAKFMQELEGYASTHDRFLYPALREIPIELPYVKRNVRDLIAFLDPLIADVESMRPSELITLIRETLDYDRFISEDDIPSPDDVKIQNINQLVMSAARYETVGEFLEYTDAFQESVVSDSTDGVRLMTIHKAKGLEFPIVFVIGMVEGIMPTKKGDIEEERRICFVGISRAMQLLYLSHSLTYLGQPAKKSIFIDEIMERSDSEGKNGPIHPPV